MGRNDAAAVGVNAPVALQTYTQSTWPPYLIDLLPQGFGRQRLLRQMGLPETAGASADWALLSVGAGNPVGNV
ncbi:HipA N-terminal domain-containing protein [Luteibacter anthropi]|nr:HipA N-terminal domain-containing protein [Luteibacter anthropi]URX63970.1 HipA N-terminal domain-containing protein [Luteibacter anthropi]